MVKQIILHRTVQTLHGRMKCLCTVLICLMLSAPSFAHPTESALFILVPSRIQEITYYNSLDRASVLTEGYKTAAFTYNNAGDMVKMQESNNGYTVLTRYYFGNQYELDSTSAGIKERLYLGGDAYSAPMVLQRVNNGSWTAYNIGRDYLGSITHIASASGTLVAEYSYDPWGRLRSPSTLGIYTPGSEPELFLGRGYTGHEHLTWFGLINMNARLYDPLLGRFLSPDPYVQAPDFTQNFNRYSYALNNPLRYSDPNGEFVFTTAITVGIALGCFFGGMSGSFIGMQHGASGMDMIGYMLGGAAIGGLAAFAGGYVGSALASIGSCGFFGGAIANGASSAASCFVSGSLFSLLNGDSIPRSFVNGTISSGIGLAVGGIIGGLSSGISSYRHGGNFWTGEGAIEEYIGGVVSNGSKVDIGEGMEYSNEYARAFANKNLGPQSYYGVRELYAEMRIPRERGYEILGDYVVQDNQIVHALSVKGAFGKGSLVYIYKSAFTSEEMLYLSIGQEYFHSYLWSIGVNCDHHPIINHWQALQATMWEIPNSSISYMNDYWQEFPYIDTGYSFFNGVIPIKPYWWRWLL